MTVTIKFWNRKNGNTWYTTKEFECQVHLDNYLRVMDEKHRNTADEVWH